MRIVLAGLLVILSLMLAGIGTYISLLSGLPLWLAGLAFLTWLLLGAWSLRFVLKDNRWLRVMLPAAFLLVSFFVYSYGLRELLRIHYEKVGFPRRYYQSAPAE